MVQAGAVALSATTRFSWSDGCTWQSHQAIAGTLASGELAYHYAEEPLEGENCAEANCKATATVPVQ